MGLTACAGPVGASTLSVFFFFSASALVGAMIAARPNVVAKSAPQILFAFICSVPPPCRLAAEPWTLEVMDRMRASARSQEQTNKTMRCSKMPRAVSLGCSTEHLQDPWKEIP